MLCVITPAAIGPQYFRECAGVLAAAAGGPPDQAKMMNAALRPNARSGLNPQDKVGCVIPVSVRYRRLKCWQLYF